MKGYPEIPTKTDFKVEGELEILGRVTFYVKGDN